MNVGETWKSHEKFGSISVKIVRLNEKTVVIDRPIGEKGKRPTSRLVVSKEDFIKNFKRRRA